MKDFSAAKRLQRDIEKHRCFKRKLKKDAVLHLRIEGEIMERIKDEAKIREISISDLIRGYLVERFSVPPVTGEIPAFLSETNAFSNVIVMKNGSCAACGHALAMGASAHLAHGPFPLPHFVCGNCYETLKTRLDEQSSISGGEHHEPS
jgi:hypothetical protein